MIVEEIVTEAKQLQDKIDEIISTVNTLLRTGLKPDEVSVAKRIETKAEYSYTFKLIFTEYGILRAQLDAILNTKIKIVTEV